MTINSWPRPKPTAEDAAYIAEVSQSIIGGLRAIVDGEPQGYKVINAALMKFVENLVNNNRIKFRFEPKLDIMDFQVVAYIELYADSQDEGLVTKETSLSTNSYFIGDLDEMVLAARILGEVAAMCHWAADRIAELMLLSDDFKSVWNAAFYAGFDVIT